MACAVPPPKSCVWPRQGRGADMATPKTTRRATKAVAASVKAPSIVTNEADPQSWLYLNPMRDIAMPAGMLFGNLRKNYGQRVNTAAEFGRRKLQPVCRMVMLRRCRGLLLLSGATSCCPSMPMMRRPSRRPF